MAFESYRKLVTLLKQKCPLAFPISVKRIKLSKIDGDCCLHKKKFYIRINKDISEELAIRSEEHTSELQSH